MKHWLSAIGWTSCVWMPTIAYAWLHWTHRPCWHLEDALIAIMSWCSGLSLAVWYGGCREVELKREHDRVLSSLICNRKVRTPLERAYEES